MAKLNMLDAAKVAGISRQTLYDKHINATDSRNRITVEKDENGRKVIDTSEILRLFGTLKPLHPDTVITKPIGATLTDALDTEIRLLREQLQDYRNREHRLLGQLDKMTDVLRQIEHRPSVVAPVAAPAPAAKPVSELLPISRFVMYERLLESNYSEDAIMKITASLGGL